MNHPELGLVDYFIHENRGLLSLFALAPKNPGTALPRRRRREKERKM
jgi:hypothetical protein